MLGIGNPLFAYSITDLGITQADDIKAGGPTTNWKAITINDSSKIATWTPNGTQYQGFLTATNTWLQPFSGDRMSIPMNMDGAVSPTVVGDSLLPSGIYSVWQPVKWVAGSSTPTLLTVANTSGSGATSALPFGINSLGEVVGESYVGAITSLVKAGSAFLYSSGTTSFLPVPKAGQGSRACSINAYGQIAGAYYTEGQHQIDIYHPITQQGVVWTPSVAGGTTFSVTYLGSGIGDSQQAPNPNVDPTAAYAINRDGLVVGYSFNTHHAFLWAPTILDGTTSGVIPENLHDLGVLPTSSGDTSDAYAISNPTLVSGTGIATIVGKETTTSGSTVTYKAVKWTVTYNVNPTTHSITLGSISGPIDLNTTGPGTGGAYTGWTLQSATSVDLGDRIVGYGTYNSGTTVTTKAFLLN
ncbi:hypothetical protein [Capsulimonas corticalis]|uniref:hypothetical protein n=1 Tax=Capsulimonas corticalis TaxID=2219043 RepID=UPI00260B1DDE|nr:hypothetical protein [Capsulimonas corticalis]